MKIYIGTYSISLFTEVIVKIDAETVRIASDIFKIYLRENGFDTDDLNESYRVRPLDIIRQLTQ